MSDFTNPYRSPDNLSVPEKPINPQAGLTGTMLRYLNEASPWLRFIGILHLIFCGIVVIGGIITSIVLFVLSSQIDDFDGAYIALAGLVYVPMGILYYFPARFIYNIGTKIRKYQFTNSDEDLELAFKYNKSLWKFLGIICIIMLAVIPVSIVLAVIGGVVAAVSGALF